MAAAFLVVAAPSVDAAVVFRFTPASAPPGTEVKATSEGQTIGDPESGFDLWLAPSQVADAAAAGPGRPRHPALVPLGHFDGEMAIGEHVRFTVPDVEAGRYTMVIYCRCDGVNGSFTAADEFEVTATAALPYTGVKRVALVLVAAALIGAGALLLFAARRFG
jgi:hypothetical protein